MVRKLINTRSLLKYCSLSFLLLWVSLPAYSSEQCSCERTISADVVALDQAYYNNRMGTFQPEGMVFALKSDVVSNSSNTTDLTPGNVMLRPGKRARPIVLRANVGDCLEVTFTNLLAEKSVASTNPVPGTVESPYDPNDPNDPASAQWKPDEFAQFPTRESGIHAMGMQVCPVGSDDAILSDGSWVGANPSSLECPIGQEGGSANCLVGPGKIRTYKFFAGGGKAPSCSMMPLHQLGKARTSVVILCWDCLVL